MRRLFESEASAISNVKQEESTSDKHRFHIEPNCWYGFQGLGKVLKEDYQSMPFSSCAIDNAIDTSLPVKQRAGWFEGCSSSLRVIISAM